MSYRLLALSITLVFASVLASVSARAQSIVRLGAELQVNLITVDDQGRAVVAGKADGGFIVAWEVEGGTVLGRRFDSAGAPQGGELQIGTGGRPAVATESNGDFVVAWRGNDGNITGAFARRFDSAGSPIGGSFQANTYTTGLQNNATISSDADGDFVIAWDGPGTGAVVGVFAQRFSSSGARLAGEFEVPDDGSRPDVASEPDGDFVVVMNGGGAEILGRRFDSSGVAQGSLTQISDFGSTGLYPALGVTSSGDFLVAWQDANVGDGGGPGIFGHAVRSPLTPVGVNFQVNVRTLGAQFNTDVAAAAGHFLVTWQSSYQDGAGWGVFARRFSTSGAAIGAEFQVNTYTPEQQRYPAVAWLGNSDFVVAWESLPQDGSGYGIFAQRLRVLATLDIDGNGSVGALTDGLLVLRDRFGFGGATLITGAIDAGGCTRCDAAAIESHLDSIAAQLDVDGNGAAEALTDGLLALRYAFGFRGPTLITGAYDTTDCSRCDAPSIEQYLAVLSN